MEIKNSMHGIYSKNKKEGNKESSKKIKDF